MKITIAFDDKTQADEFETAVRYKNIGGVKVKRPKKQTETGTLDGITEYLPLINLVVQSGFATAVVTQIVSMLKGVIVERHKNKLDAETERQRIAANERIELQKNAGKINFSIEMNGKKLNFTLSEGNNEELNRILHSVTENLND